jgi:hypothetical protein
MTRAHYGESKLLSHCMIFQWYPCLKFNHVIIKKDFHNGFAYNGKSKHKEINYQKNYTFFPYDVMLKCICEIKCTSQCIKKYKCTKKN